MHPFEHLPDVIRLRRKQLNLTQEQLARMAGVSRRQLSLLEDGANISLLFLLKVAASVGFMAVVVFTTMGETLWWLKAIPESRILVRLRVCEHRASEFC